MSMNRETYVNLSLKEIVYILLNQINDKQANNVLEEMGIDRDKFPVEWTAKKIIRDVLAKSFLWF